MAAKAGKPGGVTKGTKVSRSIKDKQDRTKNADIVFKWISAADPRRKKK